MIAIKYGLIISAFSCIIFLTACSKNIDANIRNKYTYPIPLMIDVVKNNLNTNEFFFIEKQDLDRLVQAVDTKSISRIRSTFQNDFKDSWRDKQSFLFDQLEASISSEYFIAEVFLFPERSFAGTPRGYHEIRAITLQDTVTKNIVRDCKIHEATEKDFLLLKKLQSRQDEIYDPLKWIDFEYKAVWVILSYYDRDNQRFKRYFINYDPEREGGVNQFTSSILDYIFTIFSINVELLSEYAIGVVTEPVGSRFDG